MRQLYRMHCYNRHNILDTIAIQCIVISTNFYSSWSNMTFRNTSIADSPILVYFWGPYRSIALIAIFSGSEDQNIVLLAILFFQCINVVMLGLYIWGCIFKCICGEKYDWLRLNGVNVFVWCLCMYRMINGRLEIRIFFYLREPYYCRLK